MRALKAIFNFILNFWTIMMVFAVIFIVHILAVLPSESEIKGCVVTKMNKVKLCPGSPDYVPIANVSKNLKNAIVTSEDGSFFNHNGFDLDEMKESFRKNIAKKTYVRGGSTITQQLAKNMFLTGEKTILRKIKEAAITYQLEKHLSKNDILERYLNVVEFGPNVYGVKSASQYYFKKAPANLTVLESAFLTLLLPNPKKYSVSFEKRQLTKFARGRINQILNQMMSFNKITTDVYAMAKINIDSFPWDGALLSDTAVAPPSETTEYEVPYDEEEAPEGYQEEYSEEYL